MTTRSKIVRGLRWVLKDIRAHGTGATSVVNISVNIGFFCAKIIVEKIRKAGVLVVIAAGNHGAEMQKSLQLTGFGIAVGAIGSGGTIMLASNYGSKIDIFAPGFEVATASPKSDHDIIFATGTSFASPLVAGLALYIIDLGRPAGPIRPERLKTIIIEWSTKDQLLDLPPDTPNRIAYNQGGDPNVNV